MVSKVRIPRSVMATAILTLAALTAGGCGSASTPSGSAAPASQAAAGSAAGSAPGSAGTAAASSIPAATPKQWDAGKKNPCELLTQDAAATALGSDPGPGKFVEKISDEPLPAGATEVGGCVYAAGVGGVNLYIRVVRFAGKPPADSWSDCEEPACTKIADLGDGGLVAVGGGPTMMQVGVIFAKGPIVVQIMVMTSRPTAKQDGITLGKTVAARL